MILEMYRKMFLSLIPDNLEKQLKTEKGSIWDGMKYILLSSTVPILAVLFAMALYILIFGTVTIFQEEYEALTMVGGTSLVVMLGIVIAIPIVLLLIAFITNFISFVLCKILGGKGSYTNQFYHFAIAGGGLTMSHSILRMIPCIGAMFAFALILYFFYPSFLIYRKVHKLGNIRAGFVALLPLMLMVVMFVVVFTIGIYAVIMEQAGPILM